MARKAPPKRIRSRLPPVGYANLHMRLTLSNHARVQTHATAEHRSVAQMIALLVIEGLDARDAARAKLPKAA